MLSCKVTDRLHVVEVLSFLLSEAASTEKIDGPCAHLHANCRMVQQPDYCIYEGHDGIVKLLLSRGAEVDLADEVSSSSEGNTSIEMQCQPHV